MADRYELAFVKNALSVTSTNPQEQTALIDLLFQRLLTGNFKIDSAGVVTFQLNGLFADGLVGTPSIAFTNEPTTGRYRIGAGNVGESLLGALLFDWSATRLQMGAIHLTWAFDNTKDVGASGANRPRDLFLGRNAAIGGTLAVTGATTLTVPLGVASGGTGLATGTSGGVLGYTASGTLASSAALTSHGVVIGGGAGAVPTSTTAGTTGQALMSNGASADPTFQAAAWANDFRLTLTTVLPVTTSDVTAATTLFWTPMTGNRCTVLDGSGNPTTLTSAEISIAIPATTSQMYDVFVFSNGGVLALELLAWTNDTTRATALTRTTGRLTKTGDSTRLYVGSVRTTTVSGQTESSLQNRFVWNHYNRVPLDLLAQTATSNYPYTTATWRQMEGVTTNNQVSVIVGVSEVRLHAVSACAASGTGDATVQIAIGEDSTSVPLNTGVGGLARFGAATSITIIPMVYTLDKYPAVGKHTYARLEYSTAAGTTTWFHNAGASPATSTGGLIGFIDG